MPGTSSAAALERVERLRVYSAELADWRDEAPLRVRFSAGIAEGTGGGVDSILEDADRALYRAKATGRDRVVRASEREAA